MMEQKEITRRIVKVQLTLRRLADALGVLTIAMQETIKAIETLKEVLVDSEDR